MSDRNFLRGIVGLLLLLFVFSVLQGRRQVMEFRRLAMEFKQAAIEAQTGWRECLANSGVVVPMHTIQPGETVTGCASEPCVTSDWRK